MVSINNLTGIDWNHLIQVWHFNKQNSHQKYWLKIHSIDFLEWLNMFS